MSTGKRAAGRELNHDNWNEEDEGEEAGEFKKADAEELEKRPRKVARRRVVVDSEAPPNANPFSGFGGFNANTGISNSTPVPSSSAFSFLSKIPSTVAAAPKTNGTGEAVAEKSTPNGDYLSKLKALNVATANWIKSHIDENPLCLLTPVFKDYEKYLKELEELKKTQKVEEKQPVSEPKPATAATFSFGVPSTPASTQPAPTTTTASSNTVFNNFAFGGSSAVEPQKSPLAKLPETNKISFGVPSSPENKIPTFGSGAVTQNKGVTFGSAPSSQTSPFGSPPFPTTTFGSSAASTLFGSPATASQPTAPSSTFSFGFANAPAPSFGGFGGTTSSFSFGNTVPPAKTDAQAEEAEDEEPPKNEFVPVVEDDSLYSKRCKVFVKGGKDFNDRGVGTLYIKKVADAKIQMIVRADTNLGNIIFNVMIVEGLPVSRMGKKDVMLVCIPTPDAKPPPTSVLLRVKTSEEADELLETINKYKK